MAAEPNDLDALILDEAHRIRETSVIRWTRAEHRTGRPQIEELLAAARVPVFLLDEFQVVRPGEQGTVEDIAEHAAAQGLAVEQHRPRRPVPLRRLARSTSSGSSDCSASSPAARSRGSATPHFEVQVVDSPAELEAYLAAKLADGYSARMAAGYCWPWSDPRPDGTLVPDVQHRRLVHGRGTSRASARSAAHRPRRCGPPTRPASARSAASTPLRASSTTTPASSSGRTWCGETTGGSPSASANKDPDFRNRTKVSDADVRPAGPQRLQGAADPRHARRRHLLARRGVARTPPRPPFTPDLRAGHLAPDYRATTTDLRPKRVRRFAIGLPPRTGCQSRRDLTRVSAGGAKCRRAPSRMKHMVAEQSVCRAVAYIRLDPSDPR